MCVRAPLALVLSGLLVLTVAPAAGAPRAKLWERWTAHDASSRAHIDHSLWDRLLKTYMRPHADGVNRVAYARVSQADRKGLADYLASLQSVRISAYSRDEQRAYWINLYNALTVKVVLDHYPVESIRDITLGWLTLVPGTGPWSKKLVSVEGERLSLNDIEHRILRPIWRDPRLHYAVNCASIGCPNLQREAFTPENSEALLTRAAREYVNHPRGAHVRGGRLIVSSIYHWFREDFDGSDKGVIRHLRGYADPALNARLDGVERIASHEYDWALNDVASAIGK